VSKHASNLLRILNFATGRSTFQEEVLDYLEHGPWLQIGDRFLRMNPKSVHVTHHIFAIDIETTFTLKELELESIESRMKSPRKLLTEPLPAVASFTFGLQEEQIGDQVFHFTFSSRLDFEINLVELESTVEMLYQDSEEIRSTNNFFYDRLNRFLQATEDGSNSEKSLTLPSPKLDNRTEREQTRLRRTLRKSLFYHHNSFRITRRTDRALGLLMVILPTTLGILVSLVGVPSPSPRVVVGVASFGIALIASVRAVLDLPALSEEHRYFSNSYRNLLRDLEQETRVPVSQRTPKQLQSALARITLQAQDLAAQAPRGFRRPNVAD
jgi:hypothetical protein